MVEKSSPICSGLISHCVDWQVVSELRLADDREKVEDRLPWLTKTSSQLAGQLLMEVPVIRNKNSRSVPHWVRWCAGKYIILLYYLHGLRHGIRQRQIHTSYCNDSTKHQVRPGVQYQRYGYMFYTCYSSDVQASLLAPFTIHFLLPILSVSQSLPASLYVNYSHPFTLVSPPLSVHIYVQFNSRALDLT